MPGLDLCIACNRKSSSRLDSATVLTIDRPLDTLTSFYLDKSAQTAAPAPTRYAIRQVLEQELRKEKMVQSSMARQSRSTALVDSTGQEDDDKENEDPRARPSEKQPEVKRDFFGRAIKETRPHSAGTGTKKVAEDESQDGGRIWVSFHEGFSNAVRKPITLNELLESF